MRVKLSVVRLAILVAATFVACAVEMVEALTIVLAVGLTRGWRAVRFATVTALLALAVIVAVLGPTLTIVPLATLRVVVGFLLLAFGLQWLRKAILRASGVLALHDEERIFSDEIGIAHAHAAPTSDHFDWYAFTLAFKGVFLEGLEVAFIVVVFGSAHHDLSLAVGAAAAAVVVVGAAGVLVHRPLSRVPENTMKFGVGLMLCSFGTFWGTEGADVHWPGGDAAIVGLLVFYTACSLVLVAISRRRAAAAGGVVPSGLA